MSDWKEILAGVDDDYLIGLSNKGIVKRAYKDKEEAAAEIEGIGEEVVVKIGGETVTVCFPLGESKCTCPSRSICRHVIHAVLALKEECLKAGEEIQQAESNKTEQTGEAGTGEQGSIQKDTPDALEKVRGEINAYPLAPLKKTLGERQFQTFVSQAVSEVKPDIQYSSVVTVRLPEHEFVVKLLSPLEYSACTCHKKEMCVHKAAAILWCQLEAGVLKKEELLEDSAKTLSFDMERVKEAAEQMKVFLEELFATGLSRTSPDVLDYLERLAIISHNAGLARFEGYLRALLDSYDRYFKRKATFKAADLMEQMTRLYRRVNMLLEAKDGREVSKYAGEFRAEYIPVGNLDLIGIAMEHFESQTGYEGETIYFLEEHTKEWYTYTSARPVFYETERKRRHLEKAQAPWGLDVSFEDIYKFRIHLTGARCDERRRLSSSQDTRGEIKGERELYLKDIEGWYYRDFGKLFPEQIGKQQKEWLFEQGSPQEGAELVFVQPAFCEKAEFSQTGQQLTLRLYDETGKEIVVEMTYSKRESAAIRYLERVSDNRLPCFIGKVYLRDGRVRMYPVEVREKIFIK